MTCLFKMILSFFSRESAINLFAFGLVRKGEQLVITNFNLNGEKFGLGYLINFY